MPERAGRVHRPRPGPARAAIRHRRVGRSGWRGPGSLRRAGPHGRLPAQASSRSPVLGPILQRRRHRRRRCRRLGRRLFPPARARLCRLGHRDRARPDLSALGDDAVGRLDPPAIFDPREHPDEPLRPRGHPRSCRALRPRCGYRLSRGRLSLARQPGRRGRAAPELDDPDGGGRRHPPSRSRRADAAISLDLDRGHRRRSLGPQRRGLVRRPFPPRPLPQGGAPGRRDLCQGRGGTRSSARGTASRRSGSPTASASPAARWSMQPGRKRAT